MKMLLLATLLLTVFTSAYMSRLAKRFVLEDGRSFSIMDMEIPKESNEIKAAGNNKPALEEIQSGITHDATLALEKHLVLDGLFMIGCFSSIALLCFIASGTTHSSTWKIILTVLAVLQIFAWGLDICENKQLYNYLFQPDYIINKTSITIRTIIKFAIGILGFVLSVGVIVANAKPASQYGKELE